MTVLRDLSYTSTFYRYLTTLCNKKLFLTLLGFVGLVLFLVHLESKILSDCKMELLEKIKCAPIETAVSIPDVMQNETLDVVASPSADPKELEPEYLQVIK